MCPERLAWQAPVPHPVLGSDDVHVWRLGAPASDHDQTALLALLSPAEHTRVARLRAPAHRRRFVIAHAALRAILGCYLHRAPADLVFASGEHGKPLLVDGGLSFNLSHSDDLALMAVAVARDVGIDVERLRARTPIDRLAARFFAPRERRLLEAAPPATRRATFFALWTAKEAYLKGTGAGLGRDLRQIDVADVLSAARAHARVDDRADAHFTLTAIALDDASAATVAVGGPDARLSGWRWPA